MENLLLKRIKNWGSTATDSDIAEGNYLPIDGQAGTKKLPIKLLAAANDPRIACHIIVDNPEYVYLVEDSNGYFLFGVREDGDFEWGAGMPTILKEALSKKVNTEDGKSLVNEDFAESLESLESVEFLFLITSLDDKVLFGIREDGSIYSYGIEKLVSSTFKSMGTFATEDFVENKVTDEKERALAAEASLQETINNIEPTIVQGGENNPDEEYLTSINDAITFKDRNSSAYERGYIFVRAAGALSGIMDKINVVYEIKNYYNLNGGTINVPQGCTLRFVGGRIDNGVLVGNYTKIERVGNNAIFGAGLDIQGTWDIGHIVSDMVETPEENLRNLVPLLNEYQHQVFEVLQSNNAYEWTPANNNERFITCKPHTEFILNGTLKIGTNNFPNYAGIYVACNDVYIHGSGGVVGDADTHEYTPGSTHEWGHGIYLFSENAENIKVEGLDISNCCGDGLTIWGNKHIIEGVKIHHCGRQGISVIKASDVIIRNVEIDDIYRTAPMSAIDIEPNGTDRAYRITIENVKATNCKGYSFQAIQAENITFRNIDSSGSKMFLAIDSKDVHVHDFRYMATSVGSDFTLVRDNCEDIVFDNMKIISLGSISLPVDNIKLGFNVEFVGNTTGNPQEGTIKYSSGRYIQFNGSAWVNFDGSNL